MFKRILNKSAVALFVVLGTLLIVVILANVVLSFIFSQSRLTHHQVSRIQASYAAQAGMNYALDRLRTGNWTMPSPSYTRYLCRGCTGAGNIDEPDLPLSVQNVTITVANSSVSGCNPPGNALVCINATANYTSPTP
ncbi:MAG: hypothetical protein Q8O30_05505 [Candidatus Omnitrophota bacterium]|nr:hypothetical protein [Candidatus Omnitrophota bacterium]